MVTAFRPGDDAYPAALLDLNQPPDPIFAVGAERLLALGPERTVAIVGTREASPYGVRVATDLAAAFSRAGVVVVSGLARGVDSAAHRGALEADGGTVAVLGTGVDVPYPAGNRALHRAICGQGIVLSENEPGTPARKGCFPRRNRIIAALAKVTIVVEAGFKSGAINTASQAMELGRTVAAVPGPIYAPGSQGANLLLRDGAQVISSVADALQLYGLSRIATAEPVGLLESEAVIWGLLGQGAAPIDGIVARTGLPVRQVLEAVAGLELRGVVEELMGGEVRRRSQA
jgi:DNA processing protein